MGGPEPSAAPVLPSITAFWAVGGLAAHLFAPEWFVFVGISAGLSAMLLVLWPPMLIWSVWARHRLLVGVWAGAAVAWVVLEAPGNLGAAPVPDGLPLRVASANLLFSMADPAAIVAEIRAFDPDVVFVQEVSAAGEAALRAGLGEAYSGGIWPREDPFGVGLLARVPIEVEVFPGGAGMKHARGVIEVGGRRIELLSVHPVAPINPTNSAAWSKELATLRALGPAVRIVAGDLNMTPNNWSFGAVLGDLGARDAFAECGVSWQRTFPAPLPVARLDHVLLGEGIRCRSIRVGAWTGSDHRAVYAELVVTPG